MNSGRWFEINDATTYAPASLLKVFVMLAYYAEAEDADKPALLQKQIRFEGSKNPAQDMPGEVIPHFVDGKFYSVEDVIGQMIIYSDNDALNTLVDNFDADTTKEFNEIFADLKIPSPVDQKESSFNFLTVNQYAMVFRVLYSTTYLSPRYSQKALQLLSKAHYANGLVAGVPPNTTVAHKFGVTTDPASGGQSALPELHDCGIVYYPSHPYLLCVMTRGSDFATLQSLIKDLSAAAYQQTPAIFKTPAAVSK
jgi:beta-lactamase class A